MSNKQDLRKALEARAKAKKETANDISKAVENVRLARQAAKEQSSHQY